MSATGQVVPVAMRVGQLQLSYSVPCDQEQWIRCGKADRPAAGCCPELLKRCEGWKGRPCGYAGRSYVCADAGPRLVSQGSCTGWGEPSAAGVSQLSDCATVVTRDAKATCNATPRFARRVAGMQVSSVGAIHDLLPRSKLNPPCG